MVIIMKNFQKLMLAGFFALSAMTAGAQEYSAPQDVKDRVSELRQYVIENGTFMNVNYNGVEFPTYRLESNDYVIDVNRGSTQIVRVRDNRSDFFVDLENDGDADRYFGSNGPFNQIDQAMLRLNAYDVNSDHDTEFELEKDRPTGLGGLLPSNNSEAYKDRFEFYLDPMTAPNLMLGDKVRIYDYANKVSEVRDPSHARAGAINTHAQNAYLSTLDDIMRTIVR